MPPIMKNTPSSFLGKTLAATMQKADKAAPQAVETKTTVSPPKDAFFAGLGSAFTQATKKASCATQAIAKATTEGASYAYLSLASAKLSATKKASGATQALVNAATVGASYAYLSLATAKLSATKTASGATQAVVNATTVGAGYAYLGLVSAKLSLSSPSKALNTSTAFGGMNASLLLAGALVTKAGHFAADALLSGANLVCACVAQISASLKGLVVGFAGKMFPQKTSFVPPNFGGSDVSSTESLASSSVQDFADGAQLSSASSTATKLLPLTESLATGQVKNVAEYFKIIDQNLVIILDKHIVSRQGSPVSTGEGSPLERPTVAKTPIVVHSNSGSDTDSIDEDGLPLLVSSAASIAGSIDS